MGRHRDQRPPIDRVRPGEQRFTTSRYAWTQLHQLEAVIYHGYVNDDDDDEVDITEGFGENIRFVLRFGPRRSFSINLTLLTEAELDALSDLFNHAVDVVRPQVQALDKAAHEEFQAGEGDDNPRLFRRDPMTRYRDKFRPDYGHLVSDGATVTSPDSQPDTTKEVPDDGPRDEDGP